MKQKQAGVGLPDSLMPGKLFEDNRQTARGRHFSVSKTVIGVFIVLLLIAGGVVYGPIIYRKLRRKPTVVAQKNILAATQLPEGLPTDLPFLSDTFVSQNFTVDTTDGATQGTREWRVDRTPAQLFTAYDGYFAFYFWDVTTRIAESDHMILAANKEGSHMTVSIQKTDTGSLVSVSFRKPKIIQ